jgi:hypothetical protein
LSEFGFVRVRSILIIVRSFSCIRPEEWGNIFVPINTTLWSLMTLLMIFQRFFTGFVLLHHTFQFSGAKLCFFVVIVIVPLLKFLEVRLLEFWFHDGSDFEEEIKLFDEVFSTLILGFIGVIDDDVVEPAISDIGEEMFYVKILDFEIEFATDGWGFDSFASFHL